MSFDSEKGASSSDASIVRVIDNIKKSDSDPWHYRGLELSNEMLVLLISHPNIDKAAAALDVCIGSLADPSNVPGIAHFLEHMLFMGSEKYPGENEYSKIIEGNGGYSNAYTSGDHTNYYFDINPSQLAEALDVFAQFFISPLFSAASTDRELQAVNSEFEGNVSKDPWRLLQLDKATSDPSHPYSRFSIGNTESLRNNPKALNIDIREVLLNFHREHYSANRMSLAILGNQTLDELQSLALKSFSQVQNKKLPKTVYPADPYSSQRKTICYVVPVKEHRYLTVHWVIPNHQDLYYCNPESYLSHLIGHEGNGSILSYLKKLGLASELSSGEKGAAPGFSFYSVDIALTIEGLHQWERVLYIIYQYIAMLKQAKPQEWIFEECKNVNSMLFQFREKEKPDDFVSHIAEQMRDYPLTECLSGEYELREFRPDLINELLDEYLRADKMKVLLVSKDFAQEANQEEKWFGTKYKLDHLPEELIEKCMNCELDPELHLPKPNEFIPTDFHLFSGDKKGEAPQIPSKIKENEFCRLFYASDDFYKLPKAYIYFEFRNPLSNVDPLHFNMNNLFATLIEDSLTELTYPAEIGGLKFDLSAINNGIQLTIHGFSHRIKQLLAIIIEKMVNFEVKKQSFEIFKEKLKRSLTNSRRDVPYQMAIGGVSYLTAEHQWSKDELLSCVDGITLEDMASFIPRMLRRLYTDSLMYGNLTKEQALDYMAHVQQVFQDKGFHQPLFPAMWFNQRELNLPEGCNFAYRMLNDAHQLHAIEVYFQCFQQSFKNNALLELFCHLVDEPCFDQLRTKEQLGYVVNSGARRSRGVQGFRVIVQSARELDHVNQRIESFIASMRDYISSMSDETFQKQREGYIVKKTEIPKRMHSQANKFWNEIITHQFCFDRNRIESEILKTVEKNDILQFYDHYISACSIYRRKLALHVDPSPKALEANSRNKDLTPSDGQPTGSQDTSPSSSSTSVSPPEATSRDSSPVIEQPATVPDASTDSTTTATVDEPIVLPPTQWIEHVHVWKSSLPCYPLAQSYEKIDIPVLCKL